MDVAKPLEIDILDYIRGDGRIYDVEFKFPGHSWETGIERMQTQIEGRRFFHVKGGPGARQHNWEELWYDNQYVRRGTDISPSEKEYYTTEEDGEYGQKWIPRIVRVGDRHLAIPLVTFRHKSNGNIVPGKDPYHFGHWIEVKAIHNEYKFESDITLNDVVELWGYLDNNGEPGLNFERYFYAIGFGLVGWMDPTKNWRSYIKETGVSGVSNLPRKHVPAITLPDLPPLQGPEPQPVPTPVLPTANNNGWKLHKIKPVYKYINVRELPTVFSDLKGRIEAEESLQYMHTRASSDQPDGTWIPIMTQDRKTFIAWVRSDVIKFEPFKPIEDPQPTVKPIETRLPDSKPTGKHIKMTLRIYPSDGVDLKDLLDSIANVTVDSVQIVDGDNAD